MALVSFLVVGLAANLQPVAADTAAVTVTEGNNIVYQDQTLGWRFTLSDSLVVTQLGFWDERSDGLLQTHQVGIWAWDSPASPLLQATVPSGVSAPLDGQFRWVTISPAVLGAGTYVIGAHGLDLDWENASANGSVTESPAVDYQGSYYSSANSGFSYPGTASGLSAGFFGPNFKYDPVPEPALLQLPVLLGMGGFALWRRRRA